MSEKLPRVTARQFIRVIEQLGWELDRTRGSHQVYAHPGDRRVNQEPRDNLKPGLNVRCLLTRGRSAERLRRVRKP